MKSTPLGKKLRDPDAGLALTEKVKARLRITLLDKRTIPLSITKRKYS